MLHADSEGVRLPRISDSQACEQLGGGYQGRVTTWATEPFSLGGFLDVFECRNVSSQADQL
jgi:hypothetical protein